MKTLQVSDEVYDKLMAFVLDPFTDTAESVLDRLVEIASKARSQCSRLEARQKDRPNKYNGPERRGNRDDRSVRERTRIPNIPIDGPEVIL